MGTCDMCGRTSTDELDELAWCVSVENGRTKRYCPECTRANVRSFEARLDSEWW